MNQSIFVLSAEVKFVLNQTPPLMAVPRVKPFADVGSVYVISLNVVEAIWKFAPTVDVLRNGRRHDPGDGVTIA